MEAATAVPESESMVSHMDTDSQEDEVDTRCGVGHCKPKWLQRLATVQAFAGFGALSNLTTFSLRMYLISQLTTLEKRFGFSSSQSGFILSSSQISFVLFILFFSFYGRNSHIPRILSVTSAIVGITGLLFATGHLLPLEKENVRAIQNQSRFTSAANASRGVCEFTAKYVATDTLQSTCDEAAEDNSYSETVAMAIFVVAMLIQGAATAPRAPLGGTYVDDNNPIQTSSGKYIGIMMGILTLAPVLSFGIGALASGMYHTLEPTTLTRRDPRWIGAWWLGFVVLGLLTIITASFVYCFPKRLKTAVAKTPKTPEKTSSDSEGDRSSESSFERVKRGLKGPFSGIVRVLRSPVFTATALCGTFQTCAFMGVASFTTKYIETQFYIPAYKTNLMLGGISLLGSTLGPVCGGFVTSKFKLTTVGNLRVIMAVAVILVATCPIAMLLGGQQTHLVRNELLGMSENPSSIPESSCGKNCLCMNDAFKPVCGSDGQTYYSACHAGCFSMANRTYSDCTCANGTATPGYCASEDPKVYALLMYFSLTSFAITFSISPSFMVFVRSVSESDKALALGLSGFMSTLLGHFPGPIIYGSIVDTTCILWQDSCSGRGACALYDLHNFRLKIFGTNMGFFFVSGVCVFIALVLQSKKSQDEVKVGSKSNAEERI